MDLLNHTELGAGKSIIILHGLLGSARNWASVAKILAQDYHVVSVDLRNHGNSPHAASMSYCDMANDVIDLINHLQLKNAILMGHSMGGKVAMAAHLMQASLFSALISVDIAPTHYARNPNSTITPMLALDTSTLKNRADATARLSEDIASMKTVQLLVQNLTQDKNGFRWRINLPAIRDNLDHIVGFPKQLEGKTCPAPALFLGGERSDYLIASHHPTVFNYFPNAQIKMLADAGHWLHVDQPDEFLARIKAFLLAHT